MTQQEVEIWRSAYFWMATDQDDLARRIEFQNVRRMIWPHLFAPAQHRGVVIPFRREVTE